MTQDCEYIIYYFVYFCHLDSVSFDDAFVYLDKYGNHYNYENGLLTSAHNDEGKTTIYNYPLKDDDSSNDNDVTQITEKVSGVQQTVAEYEYDTNHNVTEATNNIGTSIEYTYNEKGQVTNQTTKYTNDNNVEKTISESFEYYQNGNYLKSHTNETGGITTYEYDNIDIDDEDVDNKITKGLLTGVTDPNGNVTTYTYDPNTDELLSTSGEAEPSVTSTTSFTYENNLPKTITRNGTTYSYVYDSQNRVTKSKIGTQTLATNVYDGEQKLSSVKYENECEYVPSYDSRGRLAGESWNDTPISEYYYNDRLSKVVDKVTNTSYQYDYAFYDLPLRVSGSDGTQTTYDYDRSGGLARLTFSDENVNIYSGKYYTNEKGMPEDVVIDTFDNTVLHYNYDNFGSVESSSCGPVTRTYEYAQNGNAMNSQIAVIADQNKDGDYLQFYQLYYNSDGSLYSSFESFEQEIYDYVYDNLGRVVENYTNGDLYEYSYDAGGNLTSIVYNLDPLHTYTYGNANWKDQLTAFDGKAITYDVNGNPLTYRGYTMTWEKGRQLASMTKNGTTLSFKYDASGLRTEKTSGNTTTEYTYVGEKLVSMKSGETVMNFSYGADGSPYGFTYNGTSYFYLLNLQGDVIGIHDANGNVVARYNYDAWGKLVSTTASNSAVALSNPLRYRGYVYDTETSLYYLQSRYYDPETGRFINADSLLVAGDYLQGTNMFAYCLNNPVMYIDTKGHKTEEISNSSTQLAIDITFFWVGAYLFEEACKDFGIDGIGKLEGVLGKIEDMEYEIYEFNVSDFGETLTGLPADLSVATAVDIIMYKFFSSASLSFVPALLISTALSAILGSLLGEVNLKSGDYNLIHFSFLEVREGWPIGDWFVHDFYFLYFRSDETTPIGKRIDENFTAYNYWYSFMEM